MRLECEEDMIEGVIRKVGDDLASVIGQDTGSCCVSRRPAVRGACTS